MTENSPLPTDNFNTVIHRSPGLGQDLDWLKSLHAEKILLVTRDRTTQRRLRLQTLTDARFVVLTEDEASAAQLQELQKQIESLETEKAEAEERAEQAENALRALTEGRDQLVALKERLERENSQLRKQHERLDTEFKKAEVQLELLQEYLKKDNEID